MLSSVIVIVYVHYERKQIHAGCLIFVYTKCICNGALEAQLSERGGWDQINRFTPPLPFFNICIPPQTKYGWVYRNHSVRLSMYLVSATPTELLNEFL